MRITRRQLVGAAAMLPLTLGACSRRAADGLDLWAMGAEAEHLPALLASLPGGAPKGIRIQPLPWSAAHEKLLTAYAGGSLPDLGQVGNSWIAELTAIGAISAVPAALQSLVEGQFGGVVETNRIDGRLMALPWYVDTRLQFYRKDLFEAAGFPAPPPRWDDWKRALHAVRRASDCSGQCNPGWMGRFGCRPG